jgi:hypothetical protein
MPLRMRSITWRMAASSANGSKLLPLGSRLAAYAGSTPKPQIPHDFHQTCTPSPYPCGMILAILRGVEAIREQGNGELLGRRGHWTGWRDQRCKRSGIPAARRPDGRDPGCQLPGVEQRAYLEQPGLARRSGRPPGAALEVDGLDAAWSTTPTRGSAGTMSIRTGMDSATTRWRDRAIICLRAAAWLEDSPGPVADLDGHRFGEESREGRARFRRWKRTLAARHRAAARNSPLEARFR